MSAVSDKGLLDVDLSFDPAVERGDNQLSVTLHSQAQGGDAELLAVDASMPQHGHSSHAGDIELVGATYRVSQLDLFMTGRWQLELSLALDGEPDSVTLPIDVP